MFQNSYDEKNTLYLVATPIGNLEDITFRALNVLKEVDLIACEDTRVSIKLLNKFKINKPLIPLYDHKEEETAKTIINHLKEGKNIALISDAGTPIISDPGYKLVKKVIDNNFNVVSIPGATAFVSALITSGINPYPFTFYGFLNSSPGKRKKQLLELKENKNTIIFYEAPHRIEKMLADCLEILGNRQISISREITKRFEEIYRGDIINYLNNDKIIKGEMVVVLEGKTEEEKDNNLSIIEHVDLYLKKGYNQKDAFKLVAEQRKVSKRDVYQAYHKR